MNKEKLNKCPRVDIVGVWHGIWRHLVLESSGPPPQPLSMEKTFKGKEEKTFEEKFKGGGGITVDLGMEQELKLT